MLCITAACVEKQIHHEAILQAKHNTIHKIERRYGYVALFVYWVHVLEQELTITLTKQTRVQRVQRWSRQLCTCLVPLAIVSCPLRPQVRECRWGEAMLRQDS